MAHGTPFGGDPRGAGRLQCLHLQWPYLRRLRYPDPRLRNLRRRHGRQRIPGRPRTDPPRLLLGRASGQDRAAGTRPSGPGPEPPITAHERGDLGLHARPSLRGNQSPNLCALPPASHVQHHDGRRGSRRSLARQLVDRGAGRRVQPGPPPLTWPEPGARGFSPEGRVSPREPTTG